MTPADAEFAGLLDALDACATRLNDGGLTPFGRHWLERVYRKLAEQADRLLTGSAAIPSSEQGARMFVRSLAAALREAGQALDQAAVRLKDAGRAHAASEAKQAATNALRSAEAVVRA